jgi:hypothetical protein
MSTAIARKTSKLAEFFDTAGKWLSLYLKGTEGSMESGLSLASVFDSIFDSARVAFAL